MSMGKLDFLSPKHATARVETGGSRYEVMLDLVVEHVRKLCQNHAENLLPAMAMDEESQRRYIDAVLRLDARNYESALDFVASHAYMFLRRPEDPVQFGSHGSTPSNILSTWDAKTKRFKDRIVEYLEPLALDPAQWTRDSITKAIADVDSSLRADFFVPVAGQKVTSEDDFDPRIVLRLVWQHIRSCVCFGQHGPSVVDVMLLLGGDIVLDRIKNVKLVFQEGETGSKQLGGAQHSSRRHE